MTSLRKYYDLNNESHCDELRNLMLQAESDDEGRMVDIEDEDSDTDASICAEEREENSESEQSDSSASDVEAEDNTTHFVAVQKKRNVVVKWQKLPLSLRKRKPVQNILMQLPGVIGEAKRANGAYEAWNMLIDD